MTCWRTCCQCFSPGERVLAGDTSSPRSAVFNRAGVGFVRGVEGLSEERKDAGDSARVGTACIRFPGSSLRSGIVWSSTVRLRSFNGVVRKAGMDRWVRNGVTVSSLVSSSGLSVLEYAARMSFASSSGESTSLAGGPVIFGAAGCFSS